MMVEGGNLCLEVLLTPDRNESVLSGCCESSEEHADQTHGKSHLINTLLITGTPAGRSSPAPSPKTQSGGELPVHFRVLTVSRFQPRSHVLIPFYQSK